MSLLLEIYTAELSLNLELNYVKNGKLGSIQKNEFKNWGNHLRRPTHARGTQAVDSHSQLTNKNSVHSHFTKLRSWYVLTCLCVKLCMYVCMHVF